MAQRYFGVPAAHRRAGRQHRHADPLRESGGGRRRSHRQRRSPPTRRFGRAAGAAADRRRFRHRDDARCGDREGGVPGRRDLSRACRFRPTRCFSARRGCRASTCASRRASSAGRRSARWSRGCSTATSGMVEGLVRRMSDELGGQRAVHRDRRPGGGHRAGNAADRARRSRSDAARPENRVGTEPVDHQTIADFRLRIAEYCREIETYLCRKNDGHLIRVAGPSFELVSGWADAGRAAQGRVRRHRSVLRALLPQGAAAPAGADRFLRGRRARRVRRVAAGGGHRRRQSAGVSRQSASAVQRSPSQSPVDRRCRRISSAWCCG